MPGFFALVDILRAIALDKISQILKTHGLALERVMDIGAVIVKPHLFGPWLGTRWLVIKKQHIRLYTLGIKNTGGQTQDGMQRCIFQQFAADGFACSALKQHVVWHYHRSLASGFQHAANMLHEI